MTLTPFHDALTVPTQLETLAQVLQWFAQFREMYADEVFWLQSQIGLVEMFTNAVRHAHRDLPADTPIEIVFSMTATALEIQVWDRGSAFDLEGYLKTLPDRVDIHREGGRGLKIIQEVSDKISYTRHNDRNCFSMIHYFPPSCR